MSNFPLYISPKGIESRWASYENPTGAKGAGARENLGAKGHAFDSLKAGECVTLLDVKGCGIVQRIWMTIADRSPQMLRSLRIDMFWDNAEAPAVSAPLGDFFCHPVGRMTAFENDLFASPEGRSLNSFVPMPFRTAARIVVSNESDTDLTHLFYDVNYALTDCLDEDALYFHAHWRRENPNVLERDFEILPRVEGRGRFIGSNVGYIGDMIYDLAWWGEGEVKVYLDGDGQHPTLVGTGAEDYVGTAWSMGVFDHRYQGCLVADRENQIYSIYRLHIPDPIPFRRECRVTIQQLGGATRDKILRLRDAGAPMRVISADTGGKFVKGLELDPVIDPADERWGDKTWFNFCRCDDWSATAYFYLDSPENGLPDLAKVEERAADLREPVEE